MIRKIVLTNFMAHERSELHLADGLNVLVGPNNVGKSTIAVALKILARNTNSNFVMQHDQKQCSILVETSDGHTVEWIKRKSPSYVINGQIKDRLGRGGTPPELDDTLRLAPVEFEDKDFEPHFGEQKSPIFLINRPPSQIAQFFSTTSDAERLVAMQRLHQRKRLDAQNQSKWLVGQNETHAQVVEALSETQSLEQQLSDVEQDYALLQDIEKQIDALERHIGNYASLLLVQQFESVCVIGLEALVPLPQLHPTDHIASALQDWESTTQQYFRWSESTLLLNLVSVPPGMIDDRPLVHTIENLIQVQHHELLMSELTTCLSNLSDPIFIEDPAELCRVIETMEQTLRDYLRCDWMIKNLASLAKEPQFAETLPLIDLIQSLTQQTNEVLIAQTNCDDVMKWIAELDASAERWLETAPLCTTCGAKLTAESIRRHAKLVCAV